MNTAITAPIIESPETDPFRYGWRYIKRLGPDGQETFDQVPLTLEDVLHPEEEDFIVHNEAHWFDVYYLYGASKSRVVHREDSLVLADVRIDWGVAGVRAMGPDVAVIFGVTLRPTNRGTFYCRKEKTSPRMVMEVVSLDHRKNDVVDKVDLYYRAGVPLYVIIDVLEESAERRVLELIGREHTPDGWVRLPLNDAGRLWLEPLGLWLGVEGGRARCYDGETGEELLEYSLLTEAKKLADERASRAEERAETAEERAETAEERAEVQAQARQAAESRISALETRVRELEERLRRKGSNGTTNGPAPS